MDLFLTNTKLFTFFNFKLWLKYLYNIYISSEKVVSSESGEKSAEIKHRLQAKTILNKYVGGFWFERTTGGSVIIDYGLNTLRLKHLNDQFVSYKYAAFCFTRC